MIKIKIVRIKISKSMKRFLLIYLYEYSVVVGYKTPKIRKFLLVHLKDWFWSILKFLIVHSFNYFRAKNVMDRS